MSATQTRERIIGIIATGDSFGAAANIAGEIDAKDKRIAELEGLLRESVATLQDDITKNNALKAAGDALVAELDEARADEAEAMRLTNSWKAEAERLRAKLSECKAEVLHGLMSDISELHWAATWQSGLEYALWNAVSDPSADRRVWGGIQLGEDEIAQMKALSEEICGWSQYGEFVPMDKWLEMVEAREARK